jgi:hypothetical protein
MSKSGTTHAPKPVKHESGSIMMAGNVALNLTAGSALESGENS